jgi:hypothetical protein
MALKLGVVAALGAPAVAVLIFEVLLNATSLFNHGNVRLPARLDRVLRWIVVTPEMRSVCRLSCRTRYRRGAPGAAEHGITQPRPHDLRWVVRRAAGLKGSTEQV